MGMPGFTAEASIYKSMRNYRMESTVFPEMGNATVSMAVRLNCSIQGTEIVCEIGGGGGGDGGDGGGGGGGDPELDCLLGCQDIHTRCSENCRDCDSTKNPLCGFCEFFCNLGEGICQVTSC